MYYYSRLLLLAVCSLAASSLLLYLIFLQMPVFEIGKPHDLYHQVVHFLMREDRISNFCCLLFDRKCLACGSDVVVVIFNELFGFQEKIKGARSAPSPYFLCLWAAAAIAGRRFLLSSFLLLSHPKPAFPHFLIQIPLFYIFFISTNISSPCINLLFRQMIKGKKKRLHL